MYSNVFNVSIQHYEFFNRLFKIYSDTFSLEKAGTSDITDVIDRHRKVLQTQKFINSTCVYYYTYINNPLYVGMSTNGHANRFHKHMKTFVNRNYNKKSPTSILVSGNIRDPFIERFHRNNYDVEHVKLHILSLERDNLNARDYEEILELVDQYAYSASFFEQIMMNGWFSDGMDKFILNISKPKKDNWLIKKSKSKFIDDLRCMNRGISFEDFMV